MKPSSTRLRLRILLVILCCVLAVTLSTVPAHAIDGNAWLKLSATIRGIYVAGVVDSWGDVKDTSDGLKKASRDYTPGAIEEQHRRLSDCTAGKPYDQITAIVEKYMRDHPEVWHYSMASNILVAVWTTCHR